MLWKQKPLIVPVRGNPSGCQELGWRIGVAGGDGQGGAMTVPRALHPAVTSAWRFLSLTFGHPTQAVWAESSLYLAHTSFPLRVGLVAEPPESHS